MIYLNIILSIIIGFGLSASCGFRVFIPFLIMSISSLAGELQLANSFQWIGTYQGLFVFLIATFIEASTYYLVELDQLLKRSAKPITIIAGIITMSSAVVELSPLLRWSLAIIAGGGTSSLVYDLSVKTKASLQLFEDRCVFVNSFEIAVAVLLTILVIKLPIVALIIIICSLVIKFLKVNIKNQERLD